MLRTAAVLLLFLVPSAYQAWKSRDMPQLGAQQDGSIAWVSAKSVAEGGGYRIASLPGQPWQTKYPPLFTLYLSLVWRISPSFPANLPLATLFCWMWLPVWLAMAWHLFRDMGASPNHALLLCGVLAVNPHAVFFGMTSMTEVMFSALWMASAVLAVRAKDSVGLAALAGLLGGAAYLTKSAALPLVVVVLLYFAMHKRYRGAIAFAAAMLPAMAGWTLWTRAHMTTSSDATTMYYTNYFGYHLYIVSLRDVPAVLLKNWDRLLWGIGGVLSGVGETSANGTGSHLEMAAGIWRLLGLAAIACAFRQARRIGFNPYHGFALGHLILLVVWHYPPNERFVFPVLPVFLAGLPFDVSRIGALFKRSRPLARWGLAGGLALLTSIWILLAGVHVTSGISAAVNGARRQLAANRSAYQWIAQNTPAEATFLAYDDPLLYLYTGRAACRRVVSTRYFYRDDREGVSEVFRTIPAFAREHHLQYLVTGVGDWHGEMLPADLVSNFSRLAEESPEQKLVFRSPLTRVYRFESEDGHRQSMKASAPASADAGSFSAALARQPTTPSGRTSTAPDSVIP